MVKNKRYAVYIGLFAAYIAFMVISTYTQIYLNYLAKRTYNIAPKMVFSVLTSMIYAVLLAARGTVLAGLSKKVPLISAVSLVITVLVAIYMLHTDPETLNYIGWALMLAADNIYAFVYGIVKNRKKNRET